jgi:hypothetical protein
MATPRPIDRLDTRDLLPKYGDNIIGSMALFNFAKQRNRGEDISSFFFIGLQRIIKDGSILHAFGGCGSPGSLWHHSDREYLWVWYEAMGDNASKHTRRPITSTLYTSAYIPRPHVSVSCERRSSSGPVPGQIPTYLLFKLSRRQKFIMSFQMSTTCC